MKNVKAFLLATSLIAVMIFSGCEATGDSVHPHDTVTYSYQDADAVIEDIDMRYWFATCPRWQWEITVSCDGLTYTDTGWANGIMSRPSFFNSKQGDTVRVEITTKYENGVQADRYISKIY